MILRFLLRFLFGRRAGNALARTVAPSRQAGRVTQQAFHRATAGAKRRAPQWQDGRAARLPPKDRGERSGASFRRVVETGLIIDYRDVAGASSTRRITVHQVGESDDGNWLLRCWCHERDAWRSFRCDRIASLAQAATGEVAADPIEALIVLGFLPQRARTRQKENAARPEPPPTPKQKLRQDLAAIAADLDVLVLVARADGKRTAKETAVMFDYIAAAGIVAEEKLLRDVLGDLNPEPSELDVLLAEVEKAGRLSVLIAAALRLIEADGKVSEGEKEMAAALGLAMERVAGGASASAAAA